MIGYNRLSFALQFFLRKIIIWSLLDTFYLLKKYNMTRTIEPIIIRLNMRLDMIV